MENNAHLMARYASACQVHGLVPIVEPDIDVINGSHSLDKATQVSTQILSVFFKVLQDYGVYLEGIVLKTSMAVAGKKASKLSLPQDVAKATLLALSRSVPPAVPGVAFLSGGQTEEQVRKCSSSTFCRAAAFFMKQIQYSHVAGDFEFGRHKLLPRCCKALEIDFLLWPGSTRICIDCMEW